LIVEITEKVPVSVYCFTKSPSLESCCRKKKEKKWQNGS